MEDINNELKEIITKHIDNTNNIDVIGIVDEILSEFLILRENRLNPNIIQRGNYYLVRFKSGLYGQVYYNCHDQFMYQFRNVEGSIDKIFTPKIN